MKITQKTVDLIKQFEGFEPVAYLCSAGVLTIGYGTTVYNDGTPVDTWDIISKEEAEELFIVQLNKFADKIRKSIKVELTPYEFGACLSLAYNIGVNGFKSSSVRKYINKGDKKRAANSFLLWNKERVDGKLQFSRGLNNRREMERNYFLTGDI